MERQIDVPERFLVDGLQNALLGRSAVRALEILTHLEEVEVETNTTSVDEIASLV